jgi:hypothetical protein
MAKGDKDDAVESESNKVSEQVETFKSDRASKELAFDSSDSEAEERMRAAKGIKDKSSYVDYLMREVIPVDQITDADELSKYLGLMLHNYADRVFNSGQMNDVYKKMKQDMLGITEAEYLQVADTIKTFVETEECQSVLSGTEDIERIADPIEKASKYIKIYNYIFNKDVDLPKGVSIKVFGGLSEGEEPHDRRDDLKTELKSFNTRVGTRFLDRSSEEKDLLAFKIVSSSEVELEDASKKLLAFSQVIGRRDRREMKIAAVSEEKVRVDSKVSGDETKGESTTSMIHTLHGKSEKNQTWMPGVGAYNREVKRSFGTTSEEISATASKVKSFVQTLGSEEDKKIQKIGHLMFVTEVERNRATAFTSAMFLDEVERTGEVDFTKFSMQMKGAVNSIRKVQDQYKTSLPSSRRFDEGQFTTTRARRDDEILIKEGALLIGWLSSKAEVGLSGSQDILECATKTSKMIEKDAPLPTDNFGSLRDQIINYTKRSDVPEDFDGFKNWSRENNIVDTLKETATNGLQDKVKSGLDALDREILSTWYKIDASILYHKTMDKEYSGERSLSSESKESNASNSSNEKPPRKIARSKSESSIVKADDMRDRFERKVSSSLRSGSAELKDGLRPRVRSGSRDSSDSSRSR